MLLRASDLLASLLASLGVSLGVSLGITLLAATPTGAQDTTESPPEGTLSREPVLLRELYVPYEHFRTLTRDHPDGVIMERDEYRDLVRAAVECVTTEMPAPLPPLAAAVHRAHYRGELEERTARFIVCFDVKVMADGWVQCPLGPLLPHLASVRVDGEPGWLVKATPESGPATAVLLLEGRGQRAVEMAFSVRAGESEDVTSIEAPLLAAASATLELRVPGAATGRADPPFLATEVQTSATVFRLALGRAERFRLEWERRKTVGENPSVLTAEHRIVQVVQPENPTFTWDATVSVARRATNELVFRAPPGATVVRVTGPLVHRWERTDDGVRVTLEDSLVGTTTLRFLGRSTSVTERFTVGVPQLEDALTNTGTLALAVPPERRLNIESVSALTEVAPPEVEVPEIVSLAGESLPSSPPVRRVYLFTESDARVTGTVPVSALRFECHASLLARVRETRVTLDGYVQVTVRDGHTHELALALPAGLRLIDLREAEVETPRSIRSEEVDEDGQRRVRLSLARAADAEHPVELILRLESTEFPAERDWERRTLKLALPACIGAAASRTDLAIAMHESIRIESARLEGWRSLSPEETLRVGLDPKMEEVSRRAPLRLAAGLTTESTEPRLSLELFQRPPRGEYRAVTHVLAAERTYGAEPDIQTVRIRCDLQLAVVDRAVDQVTLRLPSLPEDVNVVVLGAGIKAITGDNRAGTRTVRYLAPWIGTRQLRVEYELPLRPGDALAIPSIELSGDFGSERFVVLQSQGSVQVESSPGPGLAVVEPDGIPDFAEPWPNGRELGAYRFRSDEDPGSLRTILHARAPILGHVAQKLDLITVIGEDGTSRTQVDLLLAYSKAQSLRLELPPRSRCLAVAIDGEPIRAVRVDSEGDRRIHAVPLPPRTFANVSIVYESPDRSQWTTPRDLGSWGTWHETGPVLLDMPVSETRWQIFHPEGYRFFVADGNLRSLAPEDDERVESFASSFFGRLLRGRLPVFTVLESTRVRRPFASPTPLTQDEAQGARAAPLRSQTQNLLPARSTTEATERGIGAPRTRVLPEGRRIELVKFGGDPEVALSYRTFGWWRFTRRATFFATLVGALLLGLRRGRQAVRRLVGWGLLFGTLFPYALAWESPFLLIPFCEALVVVALFLVARTLVLSIVQRFRRGRAPAWAATAALVAISAGVSSGVLGGVFGGATTALAGEVVPAVRDPFDAVLVPYSPGAPPWEGEDVRGKVFLTRERFRELWKLAHPEDETTDAKPNELPYDFVLGDAIYELQLEGDDFHVWGSLQLNVFTEGWATIPLPFDAAQLLRVTVDDEVVGVSQHEGQPAVEVRGRGPHRMTVELLGSVKSDLGEFQVRSRLLGGEARRVRAVLPPEAVVKPAKTSGATWSSPLENGNTQVVIELGGELDLLLTWSFPKIEGVLASQRESVSFVHLAITPEGLAIERQERLRITGRPQDSVTYWVSGDWQVTEVQGTDLTEWTVDTDPDGTRLRLFFARPVDAFDGRIRGRALLAESGPLPSLVLEDAVRQETFVGLGHGARRRFEPGILTGMERVSPRDTAGRFVLPAGVDRFYRAYGSGAVEILAIAPVQPEIRCTTEAVALVRRDRLQVFVRSRYGTTRHGPVRHRVVLPEDWDVRRVRSDALTRWRVEGEGDARRLVIDLQGRAAEGTEIIWSAERELEGLPPAIGLPPLAIDTGGEEGRLEQTVFWSLAAAEELELVAEDTATWEPIALDAAPRWVELPPRSSYRFAYRSRRVTAPLGITASARPSQMDALAVTFARITEGFLQVNTRLRYRVRFTGRDRFRLRLPAGAELVTAHMRNQRSLATRSTPEGTELTVILQSPARGDHDLDLVYRLPRSATGISTIDALVIYDGERRLDAVDQFVGVVQTERALTLQTSTRELTPVELDALPFLPLGVSARSLRPTYRATALDWSLTLQEQEIEVTDRPDAVVKLADLATRIGGDGTLRTEVTYSVINEGLQFLEVVLPRGAELWGVTVNGRTVAVGRRDTDGSATLQIPVERSGTELAIEVALFYEEPAAALPGMREVVDLQAPRILNGNAVKVVESIWSVQFPDDYTMRERGDRMRQAPPSLKYAKKLEYLVEQKQSAISAARRSLSRRSQQRAAQSLARIEQALGDNLAELQETHDSPMERAQEEQIGERELREVQGKNVQIMQKAQQAQTELRGELQRNLQQQTEGGPSRDEEAFRDRTNFLRGNAWRGEGRSKRPSAPAPTRGGAALETLLESHPYRGYAGIDVKDLDTGIEQAEPAPVQTDQGLRPLPDPARLGTALGLELTEDRAGTITYTYRRGDGDASLELVMNRKGSYPRVAAWLILIVIAAGWLWILHERGDLRRLRETIGLQ